LNELIPAFSQDEINGWALATDTLRIGLRAGPVRGAGPKTAVQVPKLREILGASETYTVQRREGFIGSYTITAPSFTVVGEARFYPLTPMAPAQDAFVAGTTPPASRGSKVIPGGVAGIELGTAPEPRPSGLREAGAESTSDSSAREEKTQTPMTAVHEIRHAYPHYDVKRGILKDPLE
jgi:hypothetical protein